MQRKGSHSFPYSGRIAASDWKVRFLIGSDSNRFVNLISFPTTIAATARLEDVAHHSSSSHSAPSQAGTESSQIPALGAAISSSNAAPPAAPVPEQKDEQEPPAVKAYQTDIIESALKEYLDRSSEIGGVVEEHVSSFLLF
jgi:hypothetical protein